VLRFSTASAPPRPLVATLVSRYPTLSLDLAYSEPDSGFAGRLAGIGGEVIVDRATRDPDEAIEVLREAGWTDAAAEWEGDDG
jgi:hypothetical protein